MDPGSGLVPRVEGNRCGYCDQQLVAALYFCPRCGMAYKDIERVLEPMPNIPIDDETLVRTRAPQALNLYVVFLGVLVLTAILSEVMFDTEAQFEKAELFRTGVLALLTVIYSAVYWDALRMQLARIGFDKPVAYLSLVLLIPTLAINFLYHGAWIEIFDLSAEDSYGDVYSTHLAAIMFVCVAPAVIEEIAFRGLIQHWLHIAVTPWKAIFLASILFSAAHFSLISAPYLFGVGVLLGWTRWKTGSLYPSMLLHFIHNYVVISWH